VPAACVGNSLGCQIVIELARRRPELVRALVLISPTVDPRYRTPTRQALTLAVDSLREPPGLWRIIWGDYRAMGLRRLLATARFGLRDRPEAKLPGIHMPVLVLRGERDMITTRGWAERCARLAENGRYVPVAKAAHAAHFTDPDEVARLISSFLAEVADHGQ
jgi:pimeloyl-ACP methyl ester carboxylesterase